MVVTLKEGTLFSFKIKPKELPKKIFYNNGYHRDNWLVAAKRS